MMGNTKLAGYICFDCVPEATPITLGLNTFYMGDLKTIKYAYTMMKEMAVDIKTVTRQ